MGIERRDWNLSQYERKKQKLVCQLLAADKRLCTYEAVQIAELQLSHTPEGKLRRQTAKHNAWLERKRARRKAKKQRLAASQAGGKPRVKTAAPPPGKAETLLNRTAQPHQ